MILAATINIFQSIFKRRLLPSLSAIKCQTWSRANMDYHIFHIFSSLLCQECNQKETDTYRYIKYITYGEPIALHSELHNGTLYWYLIPNQFIFICVWWKRYFLDVANSISKALTHSLCLPLLSCLICLLIYSIYCVCIQLSHMWLKCTSVGIRAPKLLSVYSRQCLSSKMWSSFVEWTECMFRLMGLGDGELLSIGRLEVVRRKAWSCLNSIYTLTPPKWWSSWCSARLVFLCHVIFHSYKRPPMRPNLCIIFWGRKTNINWILHLNGCEK